MRLIDADELLVDRMGSEGMAYSERQIHDAPAIEAIPKEQIEKTIKRMEAARDRKKEGLDIYSLGAFSRELIDMCIDIVKENLQ